jgi:hypothetical protein
VATQGGPTTASSRRRCVPRFSKPPPPVRASRLQASSAGTFHGHRLPVRRPEGRARASHPKEGRHAPSRAPIPASPRHKTGGVPTAATKRGHWEHGRVPPAAGGAAHTRTTLKTRLVRQGDGGVRERRVSGGRQRIVAPSSSWTRTPAARAARAAYPRLSGTVMSSDDGGDGVDSGPALD